MDTAQLLRPQFWQAPSDAPASADADAAKAAPWAQKIIEISGTAAHARVTYAAYLVRQAQEQGEVVAWIQPSDGALFPPDLHANGIDLRALVVIHVPPRAGAHGIPKAAEILLQSGAYGLVVLDLLAAVPPSGAAWLGRLLSQARQHRSGVIILTEKTASAESLGALSTSRIEPHRRRLTEGFYLDPHVLKHKSSVAWPSDALLCHGPWGLP